MQFSPIFSTQAERTTGTISPNLFPWFLVDKTPFSLVKLESSVADKFSVYQLYYLNIYIHIPIVSLSYHLYLTNHQEQHDILYVLTGWYHIKIYIINISSTYHTYIYIYLDLYLYLYLYLYPYLYLYLSIQKYIYHLWWKSWFLMLHAFCFTTIRGAQAIVHGHRMQLQSWDAAHAPRTST